MNTFIAFACCNQGNKTKISNIVFPIWVYGYIYWTLSVFFTTFLLWVAGLIRERHDAMDIAILLVQQNIVMLIYMAIGFFLFKANIVNNAGSAQLGKMVLYVVMPSAIINSYIKEFSEKALIGFAISFLASLIALLLAIALSRLFFKKHPVEHFGSAFSNAGFIGIPLVQATIGEEAVFYVASFVALLNILQWTYGLLVFTGDKSRISAKALATNPIVISLMIGLVLFFAPLQPPALAQDALATIANMNGPLAMIVLGIYAAQLPLTSIFTSKLAYASSAIRLVAIPVATLALLSLIPEEYNIIKITLLIAAAAPIGSNVAIFAQLTGNNYTQSVKDICLSTIFCIVTMPMIIAIAGLVW